MLIRYAKIRDNVKTPTRSNPSDAGLDVYYCPQKRDNGIMLVPSGQHLFSTGLKFEIPHGYMLQVMNKSGNASKKNIVVGACVVDSGYDGEVFIDLHNIGKKSIRIEAGRPIAQLIMVPIIYPRLIEIEEADLYNDQITISNRGSKGFGASNGVI